MPVNPAIAHRLLLLLAELGHPEAQADVAFHLALGIEPVAPNPRDQLFRCAAFHPPLRRRLLTLVPSRGGRACATSEPPPAPPLV